MELFGVGIFEVGLVLLIALLVVGPERFPQIAREGGKWYRMARRFTAEVTADLQGALKELEDEVNQQGDALKSVREIGDEVRAGMRASSDDVTAIGRTVGAAASAADLSKPGAPTSDQPAASAPAAATSDGESSGLGVVQSNPDLFARVRASYADLHTPAPSSPPPPAAPASPDIDPDEMAQHATEAFETFQQAEPAAVVSGGNPFGGGAASPLAADTTSEGADDEQPAEGATAAPARSVATTPAPAPSTPRTDA